MPTHVRPRLVRFATAALLVAGCRDATAPRPGDVAAGLAPGAGPARAISDAGHGGREGFHFMSPIVPTLPSYSGTFDPGVQATARVCTPMPACTTPVATFAIGSGLTVDAARQAYVATWAVPADLPLGAGTHRVEVWAAGSRLGFVDLFVAATPTLARTAPAGFYGVTRGAAAPIRFRIEAGMVGAVTVAPATATLNVGQTQGFTASATDLHGDAIAAPAIAWTSTNAAVASLAPTSGATTTATAVAVGTTTLVATSRGVAGAATLTVVDQVAPQASADTYGVTAGQTLVVPAATGLLANDARGTPPGDVASFGGGALGGAVTSHAPGTPVAIAGGGSLTVHADGSLSFTPPSGFGGGFTFQYRLANAGGSSDATVTITVTRAPTAIADDYTAPLAGPLTIGAPGVLGNDDRGVPQGSVASFGGGALGGDATAHAAGAVVPDGRGGTVELDADGRLVWTPAAGYGGGVLAFGYRLTGPSGSSDATVTITAPRVPVPQHDSYQASAGGTLTVPAATGALANDALGFPAGQIVTFGPGAGTGTPAGTPLPFGTGGSVTVNADGSLSFTAPADFGGDVAVQYVVQNASGSATATITFSVQRAPTAVADAIAYTASGGTPHVVAAPGVLANDDRGAPQATVTGFGLAGTASPVGTAIADGQGGTLQLDGSGALTHTPAAGFGGVVTARYQIGNALGTSTAGITITVNRAPVAQADAYATPADGAGTASGTAGPAGTGLLGNDAVGFPAAQITHFGGGTFGGPVTTHPAGTTVDLGRGGTLQVQPSGDFSFTASAGFRGPFTFQYRLANAFGASIVTVTITVNRPPVAANDAPAANSRPLDPFHAPFGGTWAPAAPGPLENDARGFPAAVVQSFGGEMLGGAATDTPAGQVVSPLPGFGSGAITVHPDGSIAFTPPTGFTGLFTLRYRMGNVHGSSEAQLTIAVGVRPAVASDSYAPVLLPHVPVNTATSSHFSVGANDAGDARVYAIVPGSAVGGVATLDATTGTFAFTPAVNHTGAASFQYRLANGFGTAAGMATVTMNVSGRRIWFVDPGSTAATEDGRFATPYKSLEAFRAAAGGANPSSADDGIFVYENAGGHVLASALVLKNSQRLVGQDAAGVFAALLGVTWPADAPAQPTTTPLDATTVRLRSNVGNVVTLASSNTLRGLTLGTPAGSAAPPGIGFASLAGSAFGVLTIADLAIDAGARQALALTNGTIEGSFTRIVSTAGASNVHLKDVSTNGTTSLGDGPSPGALSGATGNALEIDGAAGTFTYAGPIANTSGLAVRVLNRSAGGLTLSGSLNAGTAGRGILFTSVTGGSYTFSGPQINIGSGTAAGVSLGLGGTASVTFSGDSLGISTTSGTGFSATGGGTVVVTGSKHTIAAAGGTALHVSGTSIGAGGLNFRRIDANGGANGIVLVNTGTTAGLTVTGAGTTGSGGTIQGTSGGDGEVAGNGVYLSNTRGPSLSWMNLRNHGNHAVRGLNVTNLTLDRVRITGTNGSSNAADEGSVAFDGLTGSASITGSYIEGGHEDNVRVVNTSGVLDRLTMTGDTVGLNSTAGGNNGVRIDASGTATVNATVQTSRFTGARANMFGYTMSGSATGNVVVSGNEMINTHPNRVSGNFGLYVASASNGGLTYQVLDNMVSRNLGSGIEVDRLAGGTGAMTGTIAGNAVGEGSVPNSGSAQGSALVVALVSGGSPAATHLTTISGNTLRQYANYGLRLINRGAAPGSGSYLDATVQNNTIGHEGPAAAAFAAYSAIRAELGATSGPPADNGRTCLRISGNTLNQGAGGTQATLRIFGRFDTRTGIPGLAGDVNTFLQVANTFGGTSATLVNATSTGGFQNSCPPT